MIVKYFSGLNLKVVLTFPHYYKEHLAQLLWKHIYITES